MTGVHVPCRTLQTIHKTDSPREASPGVRLAEALAANAHRRRANRFEEAQGSLG